MIAEVASVKPRDIFCVIGEDYQSMQVAEDTCNMRFMHAGVTIDFEGEIDWFYKNLPADEEWKIEWSKFYFGLDLAFAYKETSNEKYFHAWQEIVISWIGQVRPDNDSSDVAARRVQNWIYAWNIFASSSGFNGLDPYFEDLIIESLSEQIKYIKENLTKERNHRTLELYALFVYALAFPESDKNKELLLFSISELEQSALTDILPDGVHRENSTHYHCIVLRSFLGALENAKLFGIEFSKECMERIEAACDFMLHIHRPDGDIPAFSDSDSGSYLELLKLAAKHFPRPDFLYAATKGNWGLAPEKTNISFELGGYFIQRSGWGKNETAFEDVRFLIFDCGRLGDGGHGHYDLLNFEAYANGNPLIVDPGRYTYAEGEPNMRHWFKGTAAHNTVCVDGLDQTRYRRGKPKGATAHGTFCGRFSAKNLDALIGEAQSPNYDAIHTRHIFFVRNDYWIIWDKLSANTDHVYDLRFQLDHLSWNHTIQEKSDEYSIVRTPSASLILLGDAELNIQRGWVAPQYGVKLPASSISFKTRKVKNTEFFSLLFPQKIGCETPQFEVTRNGEGTLVFSVKSYGNTDLVSWDVERICGSFEQRNGGGK